MNAVSGQWVPGQYYVSLTFLVVLIGLFSAAIAGALLGRISDKLKVNTALLAIAATAIGAGMSLYRGVVLGPQLASLFVYRRRPNTEEELLALAKAALSVPCAGLFALTALPFSVMLYQKWAGPALTDAERRPGNEGMRAWLSPFNLVWAILIAVSAWLGFETPLLLTLVCSVGALLAFPLLNMAAARPEGAAPPASRRQEHSSGSEQSGDDPDESLSAEQARVLALLEHGTISAAESAELLSALGDARRGDPPQPQPLSAGRRLLMLGAAVVLVGFLLPWFKVDLGKEMAKATTQIREIMPGAKLLSPLNGPAPMNSAQSVAILHGGGCGTRSRLADPGAGRMRSLRAPCCHEPDAPSPLGYHDRCIEPRSGHLALLAHTIRATHHLRLHYGGAGIRPVLCRGAQGAARSGLTLF